MFTKCLLLTATLSFLVVSAEDTCSPECQDVSVIDRSLNDAYCDQPFFVTFTPKTEHNSIIDNICLTFFPLPDDPNTFTGYFSTVYCDGSNRIETYVFTDIEIGRFRGGNPFCTYTSNVVGYAGCDTYIHYRCFEYGDCDVETNVIGLSNLCRPLGLSCIKKIEEIVENAGLPVAEYIVLPMKLPNRCVTEQLCINNAEGNFYRALNLPAPAPGLPGPGLLPPGPPVPAIPPPPLPVGPIHPPSHFIG